MKSRGDLEFFSTLARGASLSAAAREFGVTPSAVSKRLAQIETRLGVRLVARSTRRLTLTQEGETYLSQGRRILAEIDDLERSVSSSQAAPVGLLKVQATLGFGRAFVAPAIARFARRHPALEVQLMLTDRSATLADGSIDVAVRFGEPPDGRVVARRIAKHRRRIFAAPAYLKDHARPQVPADLARHNCLVVRQDDAAWGQWHFSKGRRTESVKVRGTLASNDGAAVLAWALEGHGVMMRSEWDAAPYVRRGQLEVLLDDYALPPADIFAVYPPKQHLPAKVNRFVEFLMEQFGDEAGRRRMGW